MANLTPKLCQIKSDKISGSVCAGLRSLYRAGSLFDLHLEDESGAVVGVHACVLAAVSPIIRAYLAQEKHPQVNILFYFYFYLIKNKKSELGYRSHFIFLIVKLLLLII